MYFLLGILTGWTSVFGLGFVLIYLTNDTAEDGMLIALIVAFIFVTTLVYYSVNKKISVIFGSILGFIIGTACLVAYSLSH